MREQCTPGVGCDSPSIVGGWWGAVMGESQKDNEGMGKESKGEYNRNGGGNRFMSS